MLTTLLLTLLLLQKASDDFVGKYREASAKAFEKEIVKLEELDRSQKDPEHAILFTGSSSVRLWESIEKDLEPWPVIRRGFGGSKFSDVAVYAPRLLQPHSYRALVVFVANDITGGANDKTPEEIVKLFDHIVQTSKAHRPNAKIFLIAITPTEKRWEVWNKIQGANLALEAYCKANSNVVFIPTALSYLNEQGMPRSELFREDKLHQNPAGYRIWSGIVRKALESQLGTPAP